AAAAHHGAGQHRAAVRRPAAVVRRTACRCRPGNRAFPSLILRSIQHEHHHPPGTSRPRTARALFRRPGRVHPARHAFHGRPVRGTHRPGSRDGTHRGQPDARGRHARDHARHPAQEAPGAPDPGLGPLIPFFPSSPVADMTIQTALISVSDKSGIVEFAQALAQRGVAILSTGGTARLLSEAGLKVTEVAAHTGSPEILDGRVKTLHPRIHGGLLARRADPAHLQTLNEQDIPPSDLLVVNLYPFQQTVARPDCILADAIENIDIGGPAMLRSAAKNHGSPNGGGVTVVIDPADYPRVLADMDGPARQPSYGLRLELAAKVYAHTAAYDGAIAAYLSSLAAREPAPSEVPERETWPRVLTVQMRREQSLRYGENPHQGAAFYRDAQVGAGLLAGYRQIQGKELSYNNIADADA